MGRIRSSRRIRGVLDGCGGTCNQRLYPIFTTHWQVSIFCYYEELAAKSGILQALRVSYAEMMTKACAIGQSSVMLRSILGSKPTGVSCSSRASAPPVN